MGTCEGEDGTIVFGCWGCILSRKLTMVQELLGNKSSPMISSASIQIDLDRNRALYKEQYCIQCILAGSLFYIAKQNSPLSSSMKLAPGQIKRLANRGTSERKRRGRGNRGEGQRNKVYFSISKVHLPRSSFMTWWMSYSLQFAGGQIPHLILISLNGFED